MSRTIVVSDIHAYYNEFVELIKKVNYRKGVDRLYILGDIVDRGPEPIKLLLLIRQMQTLYPDTVKVIRGNHDDEFLKICSLLYANQSLDDDSWMLYSKFTCDELNGVNMFHKMFSKEDKIKLMQWLGSLPLYIEDERHIYVHAGVNSKIPINNNSRQMLLWGKENTNDKCFYWNKAYENKIVVFGHVDTLSIYKIIYGDYVHKIWYDMEHNDKIGIDCGIWNNGKLAALIIEENNGVYSYNEEYVTEDWQHNK